MEVCGYYGHSLYNVECGKSIFEMKLQEEPSSVYYICAVVLHEKEGIIVTLVCLSVVCWQWQ